MMSQETKTKETTTRRRQITQTSLSLIETIYRYRYITTSLLHRIIGGDLRNLYFHLQALSEYHHLIARLPLFDPQTGYLEEYVYYLESTKPLELLCDHGRKEPDELDFDSYKHGHVEATAGHHLFVRHELMISRLRAMLELACNSSGGEVVLTDFKQGAELRHAVAAPELRTRVKQSGKARNIVLEETGEWENIPHWPDAFFTLQFPKRPEGKQYESFFYEADRKTMDTTRIKKKLRGHFQFIVKRRLHQLFYNVPAIRAVLIETLDTDWRDTLRSAASDPIVSGAKPSNLFWFTAAEFFTSPITTEQRGKVKAVPLYLEHPQIIFEDIWYSPNDRVGEQPRSMLDP